MSLSERRINIVQGEQHIADDPGTMLTTLLGSCVAACLWDATLGLGGMNHFLLPGDQMGGALGQPSDASMRYGVYAMELLVNSLLRRGAQRRNLQAKLFGGACMMRGLTDIGDLNAAFAERFLREEGIALVGGSVRGAHGRRIQFWPGTGRARQSLLGLDGNPTFLAERQAPPPPAFAAAGAVELF